MYGSHCSRTGIVGVLVAIALLLAPPVAHAAEPLGPSGVLLIAHRGSMNHAPQSTLAAIDQAVAARADRVSIDLHLSADGVPVVFHDFSLKNLTDVEQRFPGRSSYAVKDFTLAEIKRLDTGSWFGGGYYTGSRVLTFDELLTELADSPTGLTVEAKGPVSTYGGKAGIGDAIMRVLDRHPEWASRNTDPDPRLVLESFPEGGAWKFLDDMHTAYPTLPLVLLGRASPLADQLTPQDLDAHPYAAEVDLPFETVTPSLVGAAHDRGMRVGTWTVNTTTAIDGVLADGVDGVTSDQPDLLRGILAQHGKTWTGTTWPTPAPTARVDLSVAATAPAGSRVQVTALPRSASGAALRWQTVAFQSRINGVWRTVSSNATDSAGAARSSLPVNETLRVRAVSGGRVSAERAVAAVTRPVAFLAGAPAPSVRLAAQARPSTSGADPRVTRVSAPVWRAMAGRSWRSGCPVGRPGLRTLRVSYWGFDGRRHRGELVVSRGSAYQLARVFKRLYALRQPVRSLHRVETLGTWRTAVGRTLRADAGFGFACQRIPGDTRRVGSHARGTVVSLNPWENPTRVGTRGVPDTWWLSRSRPMSYVHRSGDAVVRAFAAEGFVWNGRAGRYADFRDVR